MRQGNDRKSADKGTPKKVSFQESLPTTKSSASSPEKRNERLSCCGAVVDEKSGTCRQLGYISHHTITTLHQS
ncbi:uncharacterized protein A4U43_C07F37800 [Asparagus officinalis]|uniref:Uncharacterized protein n=1 Tax=Asparagus officinalis TaxID=4686 RepID=A0A5P1EI01_ASPOF|nr:uncharacterized protein A4U43_C07F37800 [Asparagus officinalis]